MRLPTNNPPTPGYGFGSILSPYSKLSRHKGVDFRYNPDHTVYMPEDGTLTCVKWDGKTPEGNMAVVLAGNRRHALCHLDRFLAGNGFHKEGTPIGVMGSTGRVQGAHLHWALRVNGELTDPLSLIKEEVMFTDQQINELISLAYNGIAGRSAAEPVEAAFQRDNLKKGGVQALINMMRGFFDNNDVAWKKSPPMNEGDVKNFVEQLVGRPANENDLSFYLNDHKGSWHDAFYDVIKRPDFLIPVLKKQLEAAGASDPDGQKYRDVKKALKELLA